MKVTWKEELASDKTLLHHHADIGTNGLLHVKQICGIWFWFVFVFTNTRTVVRAYAHCGSFEEAKGFAESFYNDNVR